MSRPREMSTSRPKMANCGIVQGNPKWQIVKTDEEYKRRFSHVSRALFVREFLGVRIAQ